MIYAIILSGGAGTRFWPLSRQHEPKQFLDICSHQPMFRETLNRVISLIRRENIYIATNREYQVRVRNCLEGLNIPAANILFEPSSRNTFAPISLLTSRIFQKDNQAVILVLPSDHYIKDKAGFTKALKRAVSAAQKGYIVALGIVPDMPETGYGYIKINPKSKIQNPKIYKVEKFIEKPDLARAKKFLKEGNYFWNGGIFIFRADTLLGEIKKLSPRDYAIALKIKDNKSLRRLWQKLTPLSIDYAIMEKTRKLALVPVDFGWMDLGSWEALDYFLKKDRSGNIFWGNFIDIGSRNTFGLSEKRLVATIGLDNLIIVDTKDALLVCAKDKAQQVKKVVGILKQRKAKKLI